MSNELDLSWHQRLIVKCLRQGAIPAHVAFIMDGNRRYAKKRKINKLKGHDEGLDKLKQILVWCLELGIRHVTVYAFAIANFQRSQEEVDHLMELCKGKFASMARDRQFFQKRGVKVNVIGEVDLFDQDVRESLSELQYSTRDNNKITLNVCLAYSSTRELSQTVKAIQTSVRCHELDSSEVNELMFEEMMYIPECPQIDILVRTSGETRLSNFMLWQSGYAYFSFLDKLWPEIELWDLAKILLGYMNGRNPYSSLRKESLKSCLSPRSEKTIRSYHESRSRELEAPYLNKLANDSNSSSHEG